METAIENPEFKGPFCEFAQDTAKAKPMSKEVTEIFLHAVMSEMHKKKEEKIENWDVIPEDVMPFLGQVMRKRVEVGKLPINFTVEGIMSLIGLADGNVGASVIMLIDCLDKYEGETVDATMVSELYPWGFYKEEVFIDYIDNYLKPRKTKWSNLY